MAFVTPSGTYSPASMYRLASMPSGVPSDDVGAEDVPGGDVRDAEHARDDRGLGALAGPGRSHENQAHYRRNPS